MIHAKDWLHVQENLFAGVDPNGQTIRIGKAHFRVVGGGNATYLSGIIQVFLYVENGTKS